MDYLSYGLLMYLSCKKKSHLHCSFSNLLKMALKKSIQADNKNSQAKCSPAVT